MYVLCPSAGADALSRYVDWRDRGTCILFGDGCGAVVLQAHDGPCGLLGIDMHSGALRCAGAGACWHSSWREGGWVAIAEKFWLPTESIPSLPAPLPSTPADGTGMRHLNCAFAGEGMKPLLDEGRASDPGAYANLHMNGAEVFKFAVRAVPVVSPYARALREACEGARGGGFGLDVCGVTPSGLLWPLYVGPSPIPTLPLTPHRTGHRGCAGGCRHGQEPDRLAGDAPGQHAHHGVGGRAPGRAHG